MEPLHDDSQPTPHAMDYLVVLWYRKWLILLGFFLLASVALFVVFRLVKPKYQATARLSIERRAGPVGDQAGFGGEAFYNAQYEMVGSSEVAAAAAVRLGWSPSREVALEDGKAEIITSAVEVTPERESRIARIRSRQNDPKLAAQLVNAVVESYIEVTHQEEASRAARYQNDLQGQIMQLEMQTEAKKKTLEEFGRDKNLQQQQQEQILVTTKLSALSEAQVRAKVAREQAERAHADLRSKLDAGEDLVENASSSYAEQLKMRIRELEQQKGLMEAGKTATSLANDPQYMRMNTLIRQYYSDYDAELEKAQDDANRISMARASAALEGARQVEDTINQQMAEMRTRLETLASGLTALGRYGELKKDLENVQKMYDSLQQKLIEAKISDNFTQIDIRVQDRAKTPSKPAWPNKAQLAVVAVLMSVVISVAFAFFLEYMDRSVRKPEDVEQDLRLPLVGFVPGMNASLSGFDRGRIVMSDPSAGAAESYRKIRARLYIYKNETHAKVLSITSATAGEGKTTLGSNLAIAFAQAGARVLLVDADMRHPAMQNAFQMDREPGLAEYLDGVMSWESATRADVLPRLSIMPCGSAGQRSAELLESPRLKEFLAQAREKYDVIIVDTPPVLGVADSTVLSNVTDATLLVVQASRNPKWLIRRARMELEAAGAHILGVVLNRVLSRRGEYYYYHKYYPTKA